MLSRSFIYHFEELPLVISAGYSAGEINGIAEISYDPSGAWSIARIGFVGVRRQRTTPEQHAPSHQIDGPLTVLERHKIWLDTGDPIQMIVYHRLEHDWRARLQDHVHDRIFDDRSDDDDDRGIDHAIALLRERV